MHISRIQVPNFRALKNIDISFEEDFDPRIFPLASVNGGGKSTLLQYLFILLGCSSHPESRQDIKNLLSDFPVADTQEVLFVETLHEGIREEISFCLEEKSVFEEKFKTWVDNQNNKENQDLDSSSEEEEPVLISFDGDVLTDHDYYSILDENKDNIDSLENSLLSLVQALSYLRKQYDNNTRLNQTENYIEIINQAKKIDYNFGSKIYIKGGFSSLPLYFLFARYSDLLKYIKTFEYVYLFLSDCNRYNIATLSFHDKQYILYCQSPLEKRHPFEILSKISSSLFFLSSGSQVFLFLNKKERKTLFQKQELLQNNYSSILASYRDNSPNLYIHDFVPIDVLLESFEIARDEDFKHKNQTGTYGDSYDQLVWEITSILPNKKCIPENDFSGIYFTFTDNTGRQIYPEDLSHGELKRLGVYLWLKNHSVKNSIVLIDELEIGLHPDWQYRIIEDLRTFFPDNQYIIATHSYDICEAVTPAHVKELSPKFKLKTES